MQINEDSFGVAIHFIMLIMVRVNAICYRKGVSVVYVCLSVLVQKQYKIVIVFIAPVEACVFTPSPGIWNEKFPRKLVAFNQEFGVTWTPDKRRSVTTWLLVEEHGF